MPTDRTRIVAGCMTGTSLDGLDIALVKIIGEGLAMKAELLGHHAVPLPEELRSTLMSLASGEANEPIVYMRAARALGELHAEGLKQLLAGGRRPPGTKLDFVTAHGQTIWHAPPDGKDELGGGPKSWQLFDPWPIVRRLKVPVCYDLRQADLIAGGEGAPLTPIADWVMYRDNADWVVNLGGIMNVTKIGEAIEKTEAGDIYPCNLLLDGLCQRLFNERYDRDGARAMRGRVNMSALTHQFVDEIDEIQVGGSLGREQFSPRWLDEFTALVRPLADHEDILRTACHMIAISLQAHTAPGVFRRSPRIVLAGGGVRNQALIAEFEDMSVKQVIVSDDLGIPCEAREAMGWALLGALSQDGVPVSLPQVTGAKDPGVAGVWAGV